MKDLSPWERLKYEVLLPMPIVIGFAILLVFTFSELFFRFP